MAYALWRETTLQVAGITLPCLTTSLTMQTNPKKIVLADGTKTGNALKGYSRGRAQSGFALKTNLFSGNAAAFLNAVLATTPFAVAMGFGAAGGASGTEYLATDVSVDWSAGGDPEVTVTCRSSTQPVAGGGPGAPAGYGDVFTEQDITIATLPGTNHDKLHRFSFKVTRSLVEDYGNDPKGLPFSIDQSTTEVTLEVEYRKEDDVEVAAFVGTNGCPVTAPCGLILTQVCPTNGGPVTLALDIPDGFHENFPEVTANGVDSVTYEKAMIRSALGKFSIGAN